MSGWRDDPAWINTCRALFAVALAVSVFVQPSSVPLQVVVAFAWASSALVLLWWTYKQRERERASAAEAATAPPSEAPGPAAWFGVGGALLVVGIVWAVATQGWMVIPAGAVALAGAVVARVAALRFGPHS